MRIAALSVRTRLTLWHAGALTLIVCVFAVGVLLFGGSRHGAPVVGGSSLS